MLRSVVFALLAPLLLAGCPDAVRGAPGAGPDGDDQSGGAAAAPNARAPGSENDAGPGTGASPALPRVGQVVADASGNLVLTDTDVLVATSSALVRVAKNGTAPAAAPEVFTGAPRAVGASDRLFVVHAVDAFTVTAADGGSPRVVRPGRLVDAAAGVVAIGPRLFWSATSGTRALHVTDTSNEDATAAVRDGDTDRPVTHLASTGGGLVLAVKRCLCAGGPDATLFDLVLRSDLPDADDAPLGTARALVGLVADAHTLFVVERAHGIRAFSLDGSAARAPVAGEPALFDKGAIALDATHVYWVSRARGQVLRVRRDGDEASEVFAEGLVFRDEEQAFPATTYDAGRGRLAVDDRFVWVSDASRLLRFAK